MGSTLASYYDEGTKGVLQDWAKANKLYHRAGELGCVGAYCKLGCSYASGGGKAATIYHEYY